MEYSVRVHQHTDTMQQFTQLHRKHDVLSEPQLPFNTSHIVRPHSNALFHNGINSDEMISACIYILSRTTRLDKLYNVLTQLHNNYNARYQYDLYIFQNDYTDTDYVNVYEHINRLQHSTQSTYKFSIERIEFTLPPHINDTDLLQHTHCPGTPLGTDWPIDYRHMCRWQSMLVQYEGVLLEYDYYMRLDDDSEITDTIPYDIFQFMYYYDIQYSYALIDLEHPQCDINLYEIAKQYQQQYLLPSTAGQHKPIDTGLYHYNLYSYDPSISHWPVHAIAYNNFEAGSFLFWRSIPVNNLLSYIDSAKGIYTHRWGDAPIRTIVATLLLNDDQIHQFIDIPYQHKNASTRQYHMNHDQSILTRYYNQLFEQMVC